MNTKPTTILEYIEPFPKETRVMLYEMLELLRNAAPEAKEELKWGQPALSYDWILFQFAAFKSHISLYPTPTVITALKEELSKYEISSSTIKFPLGEPLPRLLIEKIAKLRVKNAKDGEKWM